MVTLTNDSHTPLHALTQQGEEMLEKIIADDKEFKRLHPIRYFFEKMFE